MTIPPASKAAYVRALFGAIAPRYDLMNRLMTGGRDRAWRRLAAREAAATPGAWLLDLAAGTGDLTLALARQYPSAAIAALDFSQPMLARGKRKVEAAGVSEQVCFLVGDALRIPFATAIFDAVTSAFMLRNVADLPRAFAEMARVTRPGGRVVCLELSRPTAPFFRALFWVYFAGLVPIVGRNLSRHGSAYRYLPDSLAEFVDTEELKRIMQSAGLRDVTYRRLMGGTVAIHVGMI